MDHVGLVDDITQPPPVLTEDKIVFPVMSMNDYSDKVAYLRFIGAFVIDRSEVDTVSEKIKAAYVKHHNLEMELMESDKQEEDIPDTFDFIRDECGLQEYPQCGWLFLEDRYLLDWQL